VKLAVFFLLSIVVMIVLLAWYSVSRDHREGGKTSIEIRIAGQVLKFGTEVYGSSSPGDRSADEEQAELNTELPPPVEKPPGRRRRRLPEKRAPDGGEA
jgi:hypothetical protein